MCCLVFIDGNSAATNDYVERGVVVGTSAAIGVIVGTVESIILLAAGDYAARGVIVGTVGSILLASAGASASRGVVLVAAGDFASRGVILPSAGYNEARGVIFAEAGTSVPIRVVVVTSAVRGVVVGMFQAISGAVGGMVSSTGSIGVIVGMSTSRGVVVGTVRANGGSVGAVISSPEGNPGLTYFKINVFCFITPTPRAYSTSISSFSLRPSFHIISIYNTSPLKNYLPFK